MNIELTRGTDGNTFFLFVNDKQLITVWQAKDRTRACFVRDGKEIELPAKHFPLSTEKGEQELIAALREEGALE